MPRRARRCRQRRSRRGRADRRRTRPQRAVNTSRATWLAAPLLRDSPLTRRARLDSEGSLDETTSRRLVDGTGPHSMQPRPERPDERDNHLRRELRLPGSLGLQGEHRPLRRRRERRHRPRGRARLHDACAAVRQSGRRRACLVRGDQAVGRDSVGAPGVERHEPGRARDAARVERGTTPKNPSRPRWPSIRSRVTC